MDPGDLFRDSMRDRFSSSDVEVAVPVVRAAFSGARARNPGLAVSASTFAGRLAASLKEAAAHPDLVATIHSVHLDDLYLACGCIDRCAEAARRFCQRYLEAIRRCLAYWNLPDGERADLAQNLLLKLLVAEPPASARIAAYAGRGPLQDWVTVAARRAAMTTLRRSVPRRSLTTRLAETVLPPPPADLCFEKRATSRLLGEALRAAIEALEARERLLLGLRLVKGLSNQAIGTMYGVDASTVSRWLARTRGKLLEQLRAHPRWRAQLSASDLQYLAGDAASQVDISLSGLLLG